VFVSARRGSRKSSFRAPKSRARMITQSRMQR